MNSIMHASEPLTTKEFFDLDVDEKLKVELIGGALAVSPSSAFWHNRAANRLFRILEDSMGSAFPVFTDIDVTLEETTVVRPDVFVINTADFAPNRTAMASDLVLAIEIMSPGSKVNDRRVKPALYRDAGIPSWRIECSGRRLALFEIPLRGDEVTHLGQVTLKVADIDVPLDLDAIARYALGE
ncbi:Uma2 family endonuclease [Catenulispora sp. NF23]|uniref:Uma2 family endonuclease n=1 Tax=Catenulispora pinistramenti TaxID=2705254 RepID=A0ABS5KLE0_9ACTN|nr:Uma2 family endonuclease [Catenulispora pinistramenti]MBS2532083.1 Uma2 family endonuclease [Catenulispora pinistramenti]MBS2546856.1 Uma2 family endonuclease [Catenulispora pinistramenti]